MLHSIECNAHLGSQFTVTMSPTMYAWPSLLLFNAASTKDLSEQPKTVKLSMFIDWVLEKVGNNQAIAIYDCKIYLSRKTTSRILLHVWRQSETNTLLPWRLPLQLCTYQQTNCYLVTLNTHMRKHIHTNTHTHTHTHLPCLEQQDMLTCISPVSSPRTLFSLGCSLAAESVTMWQSHFSKLWSKQVDLESAKPMLDLQPLCNHLCKLW